MVQALVLIQSTKRSAEAFKFGLFTGNLIAVTSGPSVVRKWAKVLTIPLNMSTLTLKKSVAAMARQRARRNVLQRVCLPRSGLATRRQRHALTLRC